MLAGEVAILALGSKMAAPMDDKHDLIGCDECRAIVLRAYGELRAHGVEEESAFRSALRVLSLRHPERSADDVAAVASKWLSGPAGH